MESIFTSQTPTSGNNVEGGGIVTAVTFTPDVDGQILGVRFYASSVVGGVYTGQLYLPTSDDDPAGTGTGTLLGTKVHGVAVTPSAWNVITFDTPIDIDGGTTYRATMHNTEGRYVSTGSFPDFTNGIGLTNGHLHAIYNGESIPALGGDTLTQGTFAGSAVPVYPSNTFSAGNYFVDVLFEPADVPPAEGAAAFGLAFAVASTGDAPAVPANTGTSALNLLLTMSAVGVTPGGGNGSAAFGIVFAVASTGEAPTPAGPSGICGWDIDPGALGVCSGWADYSDATQAAAVALASTFLWGATGRQYGACPITVRPAQGQLGAPELYRTYPVWPGQDSSGGGPYLFGGRWFNAGCDFSCCNSGGCAIVLRGPVTSVTEVLVDGEAVEESAYRVDVSKGTYLLVRTDGQCWPSCQNFTAGTGEDGTFAVTYEIGRALPIALRIAAAMLACEYGKALTGAACKLPAKMTRLSRQGVDIEVEAPSPNDGRTGIREVDDVIAALNPSGRQRPPVLLSPDLPESCDRVTIWQGGA